MGVKGLWQILNSSGEPVPLESLDSKVLAIDISLWLNQALKGQMQADAIVGALETVFNRICKLLYYNVKPVFVFDGKTPALKIKTIEKRRQGRKTLEEKALKTRQNLLREYMRIGAQDFLQKMGQMRSRINVDDGEDGLNDRTEPVFNVSSSEETNSPSDMGEEATLTNQYLSQFENYDEVDIESAAFTNLPDHVQYNVLLEITSKKGELASNMFSSVDVTDVAAFSSFQFAKILKLRSYSKKLDELRSLIAQKEISELLAVHGQSLPANQDLNHVQLRRIVGQASGHSLLISKKLSHNEKNWADVLLQEQPTELYHTVHESSCDKESIIKLDADTTNQDILENKNVPRIDMQVQKPCTNTNTTDVESRHQRNSGQVEVTIDEIAHFGDDLDEAHNLSYEVQEDTDCSLDHKQHITSAKIENSGCSLDHKQHTCTTSAEIEDTVRSLDHKQHTCTTSAEIEDTVRSLDHKQRTTSAILRSQPFTKQNQTGTSDVVDRLVQENIPQESESGPIPESYSGSTIPKTQHTSSDEDDDFIDVPMLSEEQVDTLYRNHPTAQPSASTSGIQSFLFTTEDSPGQEQMRDITELKAEMQKLERQSDQVTDVLYSETQKMIELFGLPYIICPEEAEAQCAQLELLGLTEGTITEDSDVWLFGGKTVYRFVFSRSHQVLKFKVEDISRRLGLTRQNFVDIAMVCGSDYTDGVYGLGPVHALEMLAEFSSLTKFREWLNTPDTEKDMTPLKVKMRKMKFPDSFPSEVVNRAYWHPVVDHSKQPFLWARPDLDLLRKFTAAKLNWSKDKCDTMLVPILQRMNTAKKQTTLDKFVVRSFQPGAATDDIPKCLTARSKRSVLAVSRLKGDGKTSKKVKKKKCSK